MIAHPKTNTHCYRASQKESSLPTPNHHFAKTTLVLRECTLLMLLHLVVGLFVKVSDEVRGLHDCIQARPGDVLLALVGWKQLWKKAHLRQLNAL